MELFRTQMASALGIDSHLRWIRNMLRIRCTQQGWLSIVYASCLLICLAYVEPALAKKSKSSSTHHNEEKPTTDGQHFAMEPQDQTAVVGSRVTLPCRVINKIGALQWTKDDFGLGQHRNLSGFERYSMVGSDEEGDFSLDIYPVMLDDDAKYQCQVGPGPLGEAGIRSRFAKLTVLVPPEAPKILQGDYLLTTEDREIEIECVSIGGKPAAEITWIDGHGNVLTKGIEYVKEPLSDSRRVTAKSILKLLPKQEYHNTTFTCQAQNTADRTYRSAKVHLEVKFAPKVSVKVIGGALANGRIPEGSEVQFSCQADANPSDLSYRWFINDELVTGDFTTKMIIHNVTRQYHDAVVKCEVVNAVGKSEENQTLDISYGPVFKQRPESVQADLGATVSLVCEVDGNPTPDIEWINENSDKVVSTASNFTLKVAAETAGRYFCKATVNGFPEIGAEATVYVKRAPIITSHKVQFGAMGNRAKIDCLAFSVPRAEYIIWSYEGAVINMSTADPDVYIFEEHHLPEGVRAALIIKESHSNHFGKYNCTVVNSYGSDSIVITLIAERSIPVLLIVMGSLSLVAIILMVVMLFIVLMKRNNKKPMADIIPEASRGPDKLANLKNEIRAKGYDGEYSETTTDGLSINITQTATMPDVQLKGATLGVPLAGPVKLDADFGDRFNRSNHIKSTKAQEYKDSTGGNGYAPYFEYALDYSAPIENKPSVANKSQTSTTCAATLPHYTITSPTAAQANLSLPRSRADVQQQQQQQSPAQQQQAAMGNGFLGQPLLQNGVDSRFSAIYGNPYLRTNSTSLGLPPLPQTESTLWQDKGHKSLVHTANPVVTPAPPPYRNHANTNGGISIKNFGITNNITTGSVSGSSSNLTSSSNTLAMTPLAQAQIPTTTITTPNAQLVQSPSGQFILPSNGNTKKGALATHV